jgi:hypothetical protein
MYPALPLATPLIHPYPDVELQIREYGSKVIGEVTLDQVYGGARGIKSLVWEVSGEICWKQLGAI